MTEKSIALAEFVRISWTSDHAREVWEHRLQRITKAWLDVEWLAVVHGVRRCGVTTVTPEDLVARGGDWAARGLNILPVEIQGTGNTSYASASVKAELGKPFVFRVVLGRPDDVVEFKRVYDAGDEHAIGRLLGYPSCCQEFYRHVWVDRGMVDTTWPMAAGMQGEAGPAATAIEVSGPSYANILWRWMGVRAVSHLPCSFACQATVELGKKLIEVGRSGGYGQEMDWLLEILSWPVEWSALHGLAEIKTPILKVATRTDVTLQKRAVRYKGSAYPEEGAQGLVFPYRRPPVQPRRTRSRGFKQGLDNPIVPALAHPDWYASDNGFSSCEAMDRAQQPVVDLAIATLAIDGRNVLDLGCGNGVLLKKIRSGANVVPFGIEVAAERAEHASGVLGELAGNIVCGDMFNDERIWQDGRRYSLAIVMPGRLLEANPEQAMTLRGRLLAQCDRILVYAYGEWLTRYGNLQGLAEKAGFSVRDSDLAVTAGLAGLA
jgi:hypothetical protein